ncbi:hypothetical protein SK069_11890 [Patulibacter brassicae]|jgi:hypothetical protein|uniref:DUF4239 domain-containing protein n=1 Tax=Patulibacter brassicae TaxID=1705717 RepID=A0ABU4VKB3_9ACTN|nr:hypothetical protein [Patulibacter brassicae]MDX8152301.1 hypothetical protein [Patulibacter brassicae]
MRDEGPRSGARVPLWLRRLRWRTRGASARGAFVVAVALDGVLLAKLPFTGGGGPLLGGLLLAAFLNLALVIAGGGLGSLLLRRRDPSLPRIVARDRAATYAIGAAALALAVGGLLHRPAVVDERNRIDRIVQAAQELARRVAPDTVRLDRADVRRYREDLYRTCLPIGQPGRAWCALVRTDAATPEAREDVDRRPNEAVGGLETVDP